MDFDKLDLSKEQIEIFSSAIIKDIEKYAIDYPIDFINYVADTAIRELEKYNECCYLC
jgi:hypothetical protein